MWGMTGSQEDLNVFPALGGGGVNWSRWLFIHLLLCTGKDLVGIPWHLPSLVSAGSRLCEVQA